MSSSDNPLNNNITELKLPVGVSHFDRLVDKKRNYHFVDKTLFIKEILEADFEVALITRPRRWGKTLNMSMLECFFSPIYDNFFSELAISKHPECMKYRGQYPTILVSFKDVKEPNLDACLNGIRLLFCELFRKHKAYLQSSTQLDDDDKKLFQKYLDGNVNQQELSQGLLVLSELLKRHYKQKVYILVDEYDAPLNHAYNEDYSDRAVQFMRNLFSATFKGNPNLEKGVLTGILRISKDSMLSGLNNLKVFTVLHDKYASSFGFTDTEVSALFKQCGLSHEMDEVRHYYNGYRIGDVMLYNPWSVIECLSEKGELRPYWVNTGDDLMLRNALLSASLEAKAHFRELISHRDYAFDAVVSDAIRFDGLQRTGSAFWSLLVSTGYLNVSSKVAYHLDYKCQLTIPNEEVRQLYISVFQSWLLEQLDEKRFLTFLDDLILGRVDEFTEKLGEYLVTYGSYHDFLNESNYHTFMLGLLCSLTDTHHLHSNPEAGSGRADLILIPRNAEDTFAIILELKRDKDVKPSKRLALAALKQIDVKNYAAFVSRYQPIKKVLKIGLAFNGKQVVSCHRWDDLSGKALTKLIVHKAYQKD